MRAIAKVTCATFQVVILAIGAIKANSEPGDLFASIDGDPGNGVGSIYKYTPHGLQSTVATGLFALAGWPSTVQGILIASGIFSYLPRCSLITAMESLNLLQKVLKISLRQVSLILAG
jgi:hypothetical protein